MENIIDKSKELNTSINLINDKLNFKGIAGDNIPVSIDYILPLGDNLGYTSLELFLLSFSSCVGSSVLTFLRKMKKTITGFEIHSKGIRNEEHPTGFKTIFMEINIKSTDINEDDLNKVIQLSEEKYCPVWAMIKGNVEIDVKYKINA
ncbi:MAG: OsmC family protein [Bacteroidetes bacterium]|nr:OsmC family protein [Bacteroidota bacterium]